MKKSPFWEGYPVDITDLGFGKILSSQNLSFDGYSCDEYSETIDINIYVIADVTTCTFKEMKSEKDWEELYKSLPNPCPRSCVAGKKRIWNLWKANTAYENLSARLQKKRDLRNGSYPCITGKYFKDINRNELEALVEGMEIELGENLNDWRMYRDTPDEGYVRRMNNKISKLKNILNETVSA